MKLKNLLFFIGVISFTKILSQNLSYIDPCEGEITIMAVSPVTQTLQPTHQLYQDVVDCGFNLVSQMASLDFFNQQFELIGDLNLKYMVSSTLLGYEKEEWFVKALKNNPKLGGWLLIDEPKLNVLKEVSDRMATLNRQDPSHLILVNLVGMLEPAFTGDYKSLSEYYAYVQSVINPGVWSYDYYPIIIQSGKLSVNYDQFYSDLEYFSSLSKKTERPFWAFCESLAYKTKWNQRPVATLPYLSFEAFSALAYGAQGIVYWTYGMRNSNETETYISALVDSKGKKTKAWYAAQKVNLDIKRFNNVFYGCKILNVAHSGVKIYKDTRKLTGNFGPFRMVRSGDAGVLVSHLENNGKEYIVIVNHDIKKNQKVTLELLPNLNLTDLTSPAQTLYPWREDITANLTPGGYKIYSIGQEKQ